MKPLLFNPSPALLHPVEKSNMERARCRAGRRLDIDSWQGSKPYDHRRWWKMEAIIKGWPRCNQSIILL